MYEYMVGDVSKSVSISSTPFYIGLGIVVPTGTFMLIDLPWKVENVLETDNPFNPFSCPLVLAKRL